MKNLIKSYQDKVKELEIQLSSFKSNGSINDIKKVERLTTKMFEYRAFIVDLERLNVQQTPEFINKIDFTILRNQKGTLMHIIDEYDPLNEENEPEDLTGILHLIDAIQDYAVDELKIPEMLVFNFEEEENRKD